MAAGLKALGVDDVEVIIAGRWRTFTITVDGVTKLKRKGWGRHVPTPAEAYLFITSGE